MWRYIKAAFWFSPPFPATGRLPVNLIALACLGILGVGNAGFWFLGAGLEAAYLFALATNKRFQRLMDADDSARASRSMAESAEHLSHSLSPALQARLSELIRKRARIVELYREADAEAFVVDGNAQALMNLQWVYLKLLIAQQNLSSPASQLNEERIRRQVNEIQAELQVPELDPALRASKSATLQILQRRLSNFDRREQILKQIESDLTRVDAQVDLALDNATLHGRPEAISTELEIAGSSLDAELLGDAQTAISEIEDRFRA